jgi:hypothetical protein
MALESLNPVEHVSSPLAGHAASKFLQIDHYVVWRLARHVGNGASRRCRQ